MLFTDRTVADGAGRHACAAGGVVAFGAGRLVPGTVRLAARHAGASVLRAGRVAIDMTRRDAMIPAEHLVAGTAGLRACVTGDVSRLA